jgi:hypothetical protein
MMMWPAVKRRSAVLFFDKNSGRNGEEWELTLRGWWSIRGITFLESNKVIKARTATVHRAY